MAPGFWVQINTNYKIKTMAKAKNTNKLTPAQISENKGMVKIIAINPKDKKNKKNTMVDKQEYWVGQDTAEIIVKRGFAKMG